MKSYIVTCHAPLNHSVCASTSFENASFEQLDIVRGLESEGWSICKVTASSVMLSGFYAGEKTYAEVSIRIK